MTEGLSFQADSRLRAQCPRLLANSVQHGFAQYRTADKRQLPVLPRSRICEQRRDACRRNVADHRHRKLAAWGASDARGCSTARPLPAIVFVPARLKSRDAYVPDARCPQMSMPVASTILLVK